MKYPSTTIGLDLVEVKPMSSPVFGIGYVDFVYGYEIIRKEIFVSIITDENLGITQNKQYECNVFKDEVGVRFENDNGENKDVLDHLKFFKTLIQSRKDKLDILEKL